jgi:hypothetical protein
MALAYPGRLKDRAPPPISPSSFVESIRDERLAQFSADVNGDIAKTTTADLRQALQELGVAAPSRSMKSEAAVPPTASQDGDGVWRTLTDGWQCTDMDGELLTKHRLLGGLDEARVIPGHVL